jgi:deoxyxylulose-5-phosphate synthase
MKRITYYFKTFKKIITIEDGVIKGLWSAILEFAAKNKYTSKIQLLEF